MGTENSVISTLFFVIADGKLPVNPNRTRYRSDLKRPPTVFESSLMGMTEVITDTTDRIFDWPVAVGVIGNYVAARSVVSEFFTE